MEKADALSRLASGYGKNACRPGVFFNLGFRYVTGLTFATGFDRFIIIFLSLWIGNYLQKILSEKQILQLVKIYPKMAIYKSISKID